MTSIVLHPNSGTGAARDSQLRHGAGYFTEPGRAAVRLAALAVGTDSPGSDADGAASDGAAAIEADPVATYAGPPADPTRHAHPAGPPTPHPVTIAPMNTPQTQIAVTETSNVAKPIEIPTGSGLASGDNNATIAYETATPPAYPISALREGIEGTVLLRVLVDEHGKPIKVLVIKSSGSHELDNVARNHVLVAWRFHPAQRDGQAVRAWAQMPVKFSLSNR